MLTPREQQIARLAAEALTNKEIAALLFLSEHTIKNHLFNAMQKLGVRRRVELPLLLLDRRTHDSQLVA